MDIFKKISERSATWSDFCIAGIELLIMILAAAGIYFIVTEFVISPSRKTRRAITEIGRKKLSTANQLIMPIANVIVKVIRLSPQRKSLLSKKLYSAEIEYTPERFCIDPCIRTDTCGCEGFKESAQGDGEKCPAAWRSR